MDRKYIESIIQKILNKKFTDINKRQPVSYDGSHGDFRINFACPYCGDSARNNRKKRGNVNHLLFFKCFNCGTKKPFTNFVKDFNEQIDPDKKLEMIEYLDSIITYNDYQGDLMESDIDDLINFDDLKNVIEKKFTPLSDFQPIIKNGGIYKYLTGRGIPEELHENIYQAKYWFNDDQFQWVICMLNRRDDKILGMQVRNLKSGKNRMFKIYDYNSLLEWTNIINPRDISDEKTILYNKLSHFFNILNIDVMSPITIFEGYLDSLFFPNSIGLVGVNTDMKFLESNELELRYFFDNDKVGIDKSWIKLNEGFDVFLWKKLFESLVVKRKANDPYKYLNRISKIKDMNKLAEIVPNAYSKLKLEEYFSKDIYDKKWLPKLKATFYDPSEDYNKKLRDFDKNF